MTASVEVIPFWVASNSRECQIDLRATCLGKAAFDQSRSSWGFILSFKPSNTPHHAHCVKIAANVPARP